MTIATAFHSLSTDIQTGINADICKQGIWETQAVSTDGSDISWDYTGAGYLEDQSG